MHPKRKAPARGLLGALELIVEVVNNSHRGETSIGRWLNLLLT
jgi:hypothetical protein